MSEQEPQFRQSERVVNNYDRSRMLDVAMVLGVLVCAATIELTRRIEVSMPLPFLLLYGSAALAAGYGGLRTGLVCASIVAAFVAHSSIVGYGPPNLTAGPFQVIFGVLFAFVVVTLIGRRSDNLLYLATTLEDSKKELLAAKDSLEERAERKAHQLEDAEIEIANVRLLLDNTFHYSPFAVVVISNKFEMTSINSAALKVFGLQALPPFWRDLCIFMKNIRFFTEDDHEIELGKGPIQKAITSAQITDGIVLRVIRSDDSERWLRGCIAPIRSANGTVTGATAIFVDISEQRLAESRLKDFVSRVVKTHEDDRSMTAYRLQDDIGQHLVATKMNLHSAALTGNYVDPVRDTIGRIDILMDSMRDWSLELRPAALDDLGLVSALRWYLTNQQKSCGFEIDFDASIADDRLSSEASIACFRIVQQAVTNVAEHAKAGSLSVRMYNQDNFTCLEIVDDGCGFDVDNAILGRSGGGGLGLITMRERATLVGGVFKVSSVPEQGTSVAVCIPNK